MIRYRILAGFCFWLAVGPAASSADTDDAWELWREGRVEEAHQLAGEMLGEDAADDRARHLRAVTAFVKGAWEESLEHYAALSAGYGERETLDRLMTDAWLHLGRLDEAVRHARETGQPEAVVGWLETRRDRPWGVELASTTVIPFDADQPLAGLMPAIPIRLNGKDFLGHLDTGGAHLAMSPKMAERLGIATVEIGSGIANAQQTKIEVGLVGAEAVLGPVERCLGRRQPTRELCALAGRERPADGAQDQRHAERPGQPATRSGPRLAVGRSLGRGRAGAAHDGEMRTLAGRHRR